VNNKQLLSIELETELNEKLRRLVSQTGFSVEDFLIQQLTEIPDVALKDFLSFKKEFPRGLDKLLYWASQRIHFDLPYSTKIDSKVSEQVKSYICEIVFANSSKSLKQAVSYWNGRLSHQEKSLLASFYPFGVSNVESIDWFRNDDWYMLGVGEYVVLKEKEIDGFTFEGKTSGIVTINSYKADILNSPNMAIIDVDLIGDSTLQMDSVVTPYKSAALAALAAYQSENYNLGFRVYQTAAGLRYICTNWEFDPSGGASSRMMRLLFADPKYRSLCKFQETYRARLTPKPWRMGDEESYRVCDLIDVVGSSEILPQFKAMIEYHDNQTQAMDTWLKLA
jgi:hypothetical protein